MIWLKLIWIVVPGGVANMIPPFAAILWPKWSNPVDGGKELGGKRLLGNNKTWRGLITGTIGAEISFLLISLIWSTQGLLPWWFGLPLGLGALGGDMLKSFFKRRVGVESGKSWFPWDQIDWILGLLAVTSWWQILSIWEMGVVLIIGLALHLLFKFIGFVIRINKTII